MNKIRIIIILFLLLSLNIYSIDIDDDIVKRGTALLGTPYRYGGLNPSGFDCSGLVNYLYKKYIPSLPRTSEQLSQFGKTISKENISAGDLVFYATGNNLNEITHVGIYIGQNTLIQAVSAGPNRGVILTNLQEKYWENRYRWTKRILPQVEAEVQKNVFVQFSMGNYRGETKNSEPEGFGEMVLGNGDNYTGEFQKGLFHGMGKYTYSNGDIYDGEFIHGRESGGKILKSDGIWYPSARNVQGKIIIANRSDRSHSRNNYLLLKPTNWDDWLLLEIQNFENSKKAGESAAQLEKERFEKWKENNSSQL